MSLDAKKVQHIAKLARIRVEEDEVDQYVSELSSIMKWIEQLSEVEDDAQAVASVVAHPLPLRRDVVSDGNMPEQVLANAPKNEYNCFVVPKVIDQG